MDGAARDDGVVEPSGDDVGGDGSDTGRRGGGDGVSGGGGDTGERGGGDDEMGRGGAAATVGGDDAGDDGQPDGDSVDPDDDADATAAGAHACVCESSRVHVCVQRGAHALTCM